MDELDRSIIDILRSDGRASNAEIARRTGVSEGTIRRRFKNMVEDDLIEVRVIVDPRGLSRGHRAIVGIITDPGCVDDVLERMGHIQEVTFAAITTGRYDLIAFVGVDSPDRLGNFLASRLGKVPGVQRTEASIILSATSHEPDQPI